MPAISWPVLPAPIECKSTGLGLNTPVWGEDGGAYLLEQSQLEGTPLSRLDPKTCRTNYEPLAGPWEKCQFWRVISVGSAPFSFTVGATQRIKFWSHRHNKLKIKTVDEICKNDRLQLDSRQRPDSGHQLDISVTFARWLAYAWFGSPIKREGWWDWNIPLLGIQKDKLLLHYLEDLGFDYQRYDGRVEISVDEKFHRKTVDSIGDFISRRRLRPSCLQWPKTAAVSFIETLRASKGNTAAYAMTGPEASSIVRLCWYFEIPIAMGLCVTSRPFQALSSAESSSAKDSDFWMDRSWTLTFFDEQLSATSRWVRGQGLFSPPIWGLKELDNDDPLAVCRDSKNRFTMFGLPLS